MLPDAVTIISALTSFDSRMTPAEENAHERHQTANGSVSRVGKATPAGGALEPLVTCGCRLYPAAPFSHMLRRQAPNGLAGESCAPINAGIPSTSVLFTVRTIGNVFPLRLFPSSCCGRSRIVAFPVAAKRFR